jgi:hypothetical protein
MITSDEGFSKFVLNRIEWKRDADDSSLDKSQIAEVTEYSHDSGGIAEIAIYSDRGDMTYLRFNLADLLFSLVQAGAEQDIAEYVR